MRRRDVEIRGVIAWLALAVVLSGCAALPQVQLHRVYVPMWIPAEMSKLGLGGGTPEQARTLGAGWLYDWTPHPAGDEFIEAVPMIGRGDLVGAALGGNSDWVLGFNEPDWQFPLTPADAARLWRNIEAQYPARKLVSPAPSDHDIGWLLRFRESYRAQFGSWPRLDALAMHCYKPTAAECIEIGRQFLRWVDAWGVPGGLWVTEYAYTAARSGNPERETRAFVGWCEGEAKVARYAPFVNHLEPGVWFWPNRDPRDDPSLFTSATGTVLTATGHWYAR